MTNNIFERNKWTAVTILSLIFFVVAEVILELGCLVFMRARGVDVSQRLLITVREQPTTAASRAIALYAKEHGLSVSMGKSTLVDSLLAYRGRPKTISVIPVSIEGGPMEGWVMSDAAGFSSVRDVLEPPPKKQKNPSQFRIMILGGSTVEGFGASSPSKTLPGQLRSLLSDKYGDTVELINAGVAGYKSSTQLLVFMETLFEYHPDLLIVYDGINDAVFLSEAMYDGLGNFQTATYLKNTKLLERSFSARSAFDDFAIGLLANIGGLVVSVLQKTSFGFVDSLFAIGILHDKYPQPPKGENYTPLILKKAAASYVEMTALLAHFSKANGIKFAHFLQPIATSRNKRSLTPIEQEASTKWPWTREFYDLARKGFEETAGDSYCHLDLSLNVFRDVDRQVYIDPAHLLDFGNSLVADKIVNGVEKCGHFATLRAQL